MASVSAIEDEKLRRKVADLSHWLDGLMSGQKRYSLRKIIDYRDDIYHLFEKYVKRKRRIIGGETKNYDTTKTEVSNSYQYAENNILSTFRRNLIRAFGQAANSIEKTLGTQVSAPGFFGIRALLVLTGIRIKPENLKRVDGLVRLNKNRQIFRIDLIPYIIMLIRTGQSERDRQLKETIAYSARIDLVRISPNACWLGPNADEVCNRWRDRIVSLSGLTQGFPRMEDAKAESPPLFHPNCRHTFFPLTKEEQQIAISRKIKTYRTLKKYI